MTNKGGVFRLCTTLGPSIYTGGVCKVCVYCDGYNLEFLNRKKDITKNIRNFEMSLTKIRHYQFTFKEHEQSYRFTFFFFLVEG